MPAKKPANAFLNKKYGLLTIVEDLGTVDKYRRVSAKCECGNIKLFRLSDIQKGGSTNCGCVRKAYLRSKNTKHGESGTKLYRRWKGIIERCNYKNHFAYHRYGGRGISVCKEWIDDFLTFKEWAVNNGYQGFGEVDRINNDGNYEPNNCRIVTRKQNCRNKSNNHNATMNGETKCLSEWAEQYNTTPDLLYHRINNMGWSLEKALSVKRKYRIYAD